MKKKILVLLVSLLALSCFAKTNGTIPTWMGNSVIVATNEIYGSYKTVNDFFGNPSRDIANIVIQSSENGLQIACEIAEEGIVAIKFDVTFKFSKVGDGGTCYPTKLYYEIPTTFQSGTVYCNGGPYNDPNGFGQIMGMLQRLILWSYEEDSNS